MTTIDHIISTMAYHARYLRRYPLIFLSVMTLISCSKSDDPIMQPEPEPSTGTVPYNKLITVLNFGADMPAGSQPLDEQAPIYFSLENNAAVQLDYRLTNRWDICLSSIYRSFISGNNGADRTNNGAGGPGKGGVLCLAKSFDQVTEIPEDRQFKTGTAAVGTDDSGAFGEGVGYYLYDFAGNIKGDGSYDSQHVAFALSNERTVVVRTAKGDYAKIQILSLYKDLLDPKTWKRNSPHTFMSFRYVLARAGSKTFKIDN